MPTPLIEAQAQVYIIVRNRKITLVQSADSFELVVADNQAGAGDGGGELRQCVTAEIPGGVGTDEAMGMASGIADADHYAGMLDPPVGVKQLCANRTHIVS